MGTEGVEDMRNGQHADTDGTECWYLNGKYHHIDGPAVIYADGRKYWYLSGQKHRTDGPAVIWSDGREYWYLNDKQLSKEEILILKDSIEFDKMVREELSVIKTI